MDKTVNLQADDQEMVLDGVQRNLPPYFRVKSIERYPAGDRRVRIVARLFHERAALIVEYCLSELDSTIDWGSLVSIRWCGRAVSANGVIRISRLALAKKPDISFNLFETVPHGWVKDRAVVRRAVGLFDKLSKDFRHLFNAIFWDGRRFEKYVCGPSSLEGHHNGKNGNLRHSVEVAERAVASMAEYGFVDFQILLLASLLHDAGKAVEYDYDYARKRFVMSDRGALLGHKVTLLEWMGAARAKWSVKIDEQAWLGLMHTVSAAPGVPEWAGLRAPQAMEAKILSHSDRLSGDGDLFGRLVREEGGIGLFHKHLGRNVYSFMRKSPKHDVNR